MNKKYSLLQIVALLSLLLLTGCGATEDISTPQENDATTQNVVPELENTDWQAVSTDAVAFDLDGGLDNPNFEYVFNHTDTVPLDQLIAFDLAADALSEGSSDELRSRFLEAPNKVLAYLVLMGDQQVDFWDNPPAAEVICMSIASADAAWHGGSEEFAKTMETCRENYPSGPVAHLLDVMEAEHKASLERNQ
ncbi:MAG: hypothetical protein MR999_07675 [Flintibacter sp.]|uniref:hypothetical protein n=1 Tax=Flintibacter sp. TaxID=1918624 RepID=UPI002D805114|nr:hypothetical protein [Flintibacter sp.]MCI7159267.1 hypothetical protein [Flintibacter sp.]